VPDRIHLVETEEEVDRLSLDPERCAYVTQTTLSVDDARRIIARLTARYPRILGPKKDDICYATQNRQDAVKQLATQCDLVLVIGSPNSSNSNRLREVAAALGIPARLIEDETALTAETLGQARRIGLTAGASAPEELVQRVLARLRQLGVSDIAELPGVAENVRFTLPKTLTEAT
jgi:4-hydroxy-3-methylbut-2-enyl diphosphate reductase